MVTDGRKGETSEALVPLPSPFLFHMRFAHGVVRLPRAAAFACGDEGVGFRER
jgi:hypothetical protein